MVKAIFPAGVSTLTVHGLHQWDYGQQLEIHDEELPAALVEIHFACVGMDEAVVRVCDVDNGVVTAAIPDRCLEQTAPITAWVYVIDGTTGTTRKEVNLPIIPRTKPQPSGTVPEEVADKYTEAVTAMNEIVEELRSAGVVPYADNAGHADEADHASSADVAARATDALTLQGGESIVSGDLNSYTTPGNYCIESDDYVSSIANLPNQTAGVLKVISGTGTIAAGAAWYCILQIFITHSRGCMYVRQMTHNEYGDNWKEWKQFAGEGTHASTADWAASAGSATLASGLVSTKKVSEVQLVFRDSTLTSGEWVIFSKLVENYVVDSIHSLADAVAFIKANCESYRPYSATGFLNTTHDTVAALYHDGSAVYVLSTRASTGVISATDISTLFGTVDVTSEIKVYG